MVYTTLKVHSVRLGTIAYSTENPELVIKALGNTIPPLLRSKALAKITKRRLVGYFGNPIHRITLIITKKPATATLEYVLRKKLDERDRSLILGELEKYYDPDSQEFFIRISKSRLFNDSMVLVSGIQESPVKIAIKFEQHGGRKERTNRVLKFLANELSGGDVSL